MLHFKTSMMLVISLFILCAGALAEYREIKIDHAEHLFEKFIMDHNKNYQSDHEKELRFKVFKENLHEINHLNRKYSDNNLGINLFSDLTKEEFAATYHGCTIPSQGSNCTKVRVNRSQLPRRAPKSFDWRDHGVVTSVKNQEHCNGCWAFSTMGNIESQYAIKHNVQLDLSEQQEIDCDKSNNGCNGGQMDHAILNLMDIGGVMLEEDYPFMGKNEECLFDPSKVKVKVTDCLDFSGADEETIKDILVNYGPLTVGLAAEYMKLYDYGVLKCCHHELNHALLVVGYGTDERTKEPYWIIKNSWSENWGEEGYLRLAMGNPECVFGQYELTTSLVA